MPCQALRPQHLTIVRPQDFELGKCGAPIAPDCLYLDIPKTFAFNYLLPANTVDTELKQQLDVRSEFILKNISLQPIGRTTNDFYVRFQFPNGRYHSNTRVHASAYCNVAGRRLLIDPVVPCPMGSYMGIELEEASGSAQGVMFLFGGVVRIYIKP